MIYAFYSKLSKKLKNGIEILAGQAVFNIMGIKTVQMLFGSITQELLGLPKSFVNFDANFEFLGQFTIRCIPFFKKVFIILR